MSTEDGVTYTVKELIGMLEKTVTGQLTDIIIQIKEVNAKLDLKASEIRVNELEERIEEAEKTIIQLRLERAGSVAISGLWKIVFTAVGGTMLSAVVALLYTLAQGGH